MVAIAVAAAAVVVFATVDPFEPSGLVHAPAERTSNVESD